VSYQGQELSFAPPWPACRGGGVGPAGGLRAEEVRTAEALRAAADARNVPINPAWAGPSS